MKLVSFSKGGKDSYGVVTDGGIVDVGKKLGSKYPTLKDAIAAGALKEVEAAAKGQQPDAKLSDVSLGFPIPNPGKILCAGRNYRAYHEVQEMGNAPKYPSIFARYISSFVPHGQPLVRPKVSEQLDFEGELCAVIGKKGRHIAKDKALDYVVGYTILNEGSVRDWQGKGTQNFPGKNFDKSGSIGPWMVTADEIGDPSKLHIKTTLNGKVMQDGGTDLMIFDIPYMLAHASQALELNPGDLLTTGSPGGSGIEHKPPVWMKPGDTLEVEISKIGVLKNPVVAE